MKAKILTSMLLAAALFVFGIGAAAQRSSEDQTQQNQTTQGQSEPGMMGQGQGMMGGGMMGQRQGQGLMGQMTTHHQQMVTLMNKLMESMAAIQNEKDPVALKSKLAEHQALLNQMRSQMMGQAKRMQMMSGQVKQSCPLAGDNNPSTK